MKGKVPRPKHRSGVMPTKREEPVHKVLPRKKKHKKPDDQQYNKVIHPDNLELLSDYLKDVEDSTVSIEVQTLVKALERLMVSYEISIPDHCNVDWDEDYREAQTLVKLYKK